MGIPSGFPLDIRSFHRFETAEEVFDGTGHHMMDTGHAIGGGRAFIKNKGFMVLSLFQAPVEGILPVPFPQNLPADPGKIKILVFGKLPAHPYYELFVTLLKNSPQR